MRMRWRLHGGLVGLLAGGVGCVNPNLYAVPRPVPKNKLEIVVAPEVTGFGSSEPGSSNLDRLVPALPTVGVRYGLAQDVDLGGRFSNLLTMSGDIKWNPIRSSAFDLAIAPGLQFYQVFDVGENAEGDDEIELFDDGDEQADRTVAILHLPLILGFNVSPSFIIVPTVGISYAVADEPPPDASDIERSQVVRGAFLRAGLGLDIKLVDNLAVHPEFTLMRGLSEMDGYMLYMGGVGFVFGSLPEY